MTPGAAPSVCLRIRSLIVATVAGVVVVVTLWGLRIILDTGIQPTPGVWRGIEAVLLVITVGSCIALPLCLTIGLPLWHLAVRSGRQTRRDARRAGLIAGAAIGLVMAGVGIDTGGRFEALLDFLGYCLAGLCAGSIAHRTAYPP